MLPVTSPPSCFAAFHCLRLLLLFLARRFTFLLFLHPAFPRFLITLLWPEFPEGTIFESIWKSLHPVYLPLSCKLMGVCGGVCCGVCCVFFFIFVLSSGSLNRRQQSGVIPHGCRIATSIWSRTNRRCSESVSMYQLVLMSSCKVAHCANASGQSSAKSTVPAA